MNENQKQPVIVVAAYDRPRSLQRILDSLRNAKNIKKAKLIISIDNNEPHNHNVRDLASEFSWPFGEKEVHYQSKHLGLRKHILQCGDLSNEYGAVIILEDDLYVSPHFYDYAVKAIAFYGEDPQIGGISLYNQPYQEFEQFPFTPVHDNSDVYFMQFPSSYGQAWTKRHWKEFKDWYDNNPDLSKIAIPDYISRWPETSWKKYFCAFLVDSHKFFVFPRISFTTNFNDPGTNLKQSVNHEGQTPLSLSRDHYRFIEFDASYCKYDSHMELGAAQVKQLSPHLRDYSFEFDLYGSKIPQKVNTPYLITSKPARNPVVGFKRALKPHEMNVILNLRGDDIVLCKTEDLLTEANSHGRRISNYKYFYTRNILGWKTLAYSYFQRFKQRLFK